MQNCHSGARAQPASPESIVVNVNRIMRPVAGDSERVRAEAVCRHLADGARTMQSRNTSFSKAVEDFVPGFRARVLRPRPGMTRLQFKLRHYHIAKHGGRRPRVRAVALPD